MQLLKFTNKSNKSRSNYSLLSLFILDVKNGLGLIIIGRNRVKGLPFWIDVEVLNANVEFISENILLTGYSK